MIKATAITETGKPIILLGLSKANLERMSADHPVRVELEEMRLAPATVMIFTGETEEAMLADLQAAGVGIGELVDTKTPYVNRQQEIARRLCQKLHYIDIERSSDLDEWVEVVEAVMTLATEVEVSSERT